MRASIPSPTSSARKRDMLAVGPLSAALLEHSRRPPVGKDLPLADLTGCFVQSDRNAVCKQGPSFSRGPWAGRPMDSTLRCQHCRHVIGVYEPMIVLTDGEARSTSRAAEQECGAVVGECYHDACYAQAFSQSPDLE
jgi:hypothetical protein